MRSLTAAMQATKDGDQTLATCWLVTRLDGFKLAATSFQENLIFEGETYLAATGFSRTDHQQKAGFGAGNHEIKGFLDSELITKEDILAEKYFGAMVEMFQVDYTDLTAGRIPLSVGKLGRAKFEDDVFLIEFRDLISNYEKPIGELYGPYCRVSALGSPLVDPVTGRPGCGVDLSTYEVTGLITTAGTDKRTFIDASRTEAENYFTSGVLTFTSGLNTGRAGDVKRFLADGTFEFMRPFPYDFANGDAYTATPGCNKLLKMPGDVKGTPYTGDCLVKFNNAVNFVGEPEALEAALVFGGLS